MEARQQTPLYLHTRDKLVAQIESGGLTPHSALPSERQLAEEMCISRMTARRALAEVEKAGYAYRNGRKGRFVAEQRLSHDVGTTLSFAAKALSESMNLSIEVISKSTKAADDVLAAKLAIEPGTPVHDYKRVFRIDGKTVLVERESAVAERFPDLLEQDLSQSTTILQENRYGILATRGRVTIRCVEIPGEDQSLFAAENAVFGMQVELTVFDAREEPFCHGLQIWSADAAEFTLLATPGVGVEM